MKGTPVWVVLWGVVGALLASLVGLPMDAAADQFAVVLQAGKKGPDGSARAVHAFVYAKELKEHGHAVILIFDGAGTEWAEELSDPKSPSKLKPLYDEFRATGTTEIICDYCANAFGVKKKLTERAAPLVGEYAGHPSIAKWVEQGYQLIIL